MKAGSASSTHSTILNLDQMQTNWELMMIFQKHQAVFRKLARGAAVDSVVDLLAVEDPVEVEL